MTSKGQTTVPNSVRKMIGLKEGDKILYTPHENGFLITKLEAGYSTCPCCQGTGIVKEKGSD